MSGVPEVRIRYRRPPDREEIHRQHLVADLPEVKITLARCVSLEKPVEIGGGVALEEGSDAVWFTFPGAWHDIGRFHRADGTFTGIYANVLTPPVLDGSEWSTVDLFLDLWIADGTLMVLDREQLDQAEVRGWVEPGTADRAREEAARLVRAYGAGEWPPPVVAEWTRDRALEAMAEP